MRIRPRLHLLFGTLVLVSSIFAQEPPKAPEGYTWVTAKPMKGTFLLPKGWNFLEEQQGDTAACFITKEKITSSTGFDTGVSINLLKNIPAKLKMSPSQYAQRLIDILGQKNETIKKVTNKVGPFEHQAIEFINRDTSGHSIHIWQIIIANDKTGSAYIVTAESPDKLWVQNWPALEKITSLLGVDDAM